MGVSQLASRSMLMDTIFVAILKYLMPYKFKSPNRFTCSSIWSEISCHRLRHDTPELEFPGPGFFWGKTFSFQSVSSSQSTQILAYIQIVWPYVASFQNIVAGAADSEYYSEKLPINFPLSDGSWDHLGRSSDHLGRSSDHPGRRILSPFSMRKMRYNRPVILRNQSEPRDTNQWNNPDRGERDLLGRGERDSTTVIPSAPEIFELGRASVTVRNVSSLPAVADPLREIDCSGSLANTATPQNPDAQCSTGYNPTRQQHQRHCHMFATASPGHPFLVLTSAPDWIPEYQSICPLCSNQNSSLPSYAASVGGVCSSAATVSNQSAAGAFVWRHKLLPRKSLS